MWPSTDTELKEEETHLLKFFFGIFAFCIWFFFLAGVVVVVASEVDDAASVGAVGAQKGDGQEERQHSAGRSDHENGSFRPRFCSLKHARYSL